MDALGIKKRGVLINDVFENQPAAKAGIIGGDVILSLDGIRTTTPNDLRNAVAAISAGKKIPVQIIRDGKEKTISVVLASRDGNHEAVAVSSKGSKNALGVTFSKSASGSLVIESITAKGIAAQYGLRKGDIIQEIKILKNAPFRMVKNEAELNKYTKSVKKGQPFVLKIMRNNRTVFTALKKQ